MGDKIVGGSVRCLAAENEATFSDATVDDIAFKEGIFRVGVQLNPEAGI